MGGLLVLVLVGVYIGIALYVSLATVKPWSGKIISMLVFVLIPTADAMYGRAKLTRFCEAEGGLKVHKVIDGVEGFSVGNQRPSIEWITKYNYRYVDGDDLDGRPLRIELVEGKVVEKRNIISQSRYVVERVETHSGPYAREELRIRDQTTNEILAAATNISYEGGWVERLVAKIYASKGFAGACQEGEKRIWPDEIVRRTLRPKH